MSAPARAIQRAIGRASSARSEYLSRCASVRAGPSSNRATALARANAGGSAIACSEMSPCPRSCSNGVPRRSQNGRAPAARAERSMQIRRGAAGKAGRRIERVKRGSSQARDESAAAPRPGEAGRLLGVQRRNSVHSPTLARTGALREGRLEDKGRPMPPPTPPRIFDRALISRRLDRAWTRPGADAQADFLLARAAADLGERVSLVK